jgi:serine protease Do
MESTWKLTARTVALSIVLGFGAGVLGCALAYGYLSDYARMLGEYTAPARLSDELPRSTPTTYADAVHDVTDAALPAVATLYPVGSFASPIASGAVLTSDGWIVTMMEHLPNLVGDVAVVGGKPYSITHYADDPATGAVFVKIDVSNLPVFAFGSGFDLVPGDQLFAAPSGSSLFSTTFVQAHWEPGALSSDVPERRLMLGNATLGSRLGSPVVNVRGELVGLIEGSRDNMALVLPTDGILSAFNAVLRDGNATRASLGVAATDLSRNLGLSESDTLGLSQGALLLGSSSVKKGSVAADAGLVPGDIIVSVDGTPVDARRSLDEFIVTRAPGDIITLRVISTSGEREVKATLTPLKP